MFATCEKCQSFAQERNLCEVHKIKRENGVAACEQFTRLPKYLGKRLMLFPDGDSIKNAINRSRAQGAT